MRISNPRIVFNEIPNGLPNATTLVVDGAQTIDLDEVPLQGGILVKVLALSLDPYMRNRMRPADVPGDMPAFPLGDVVTGFGVGVVLRSETSLVNVDEHVYGFIAYQRYIVIPSINGNALDMEGLGLQIIHNKYNLPWRYYVGILGMSGQTAYYGLKDISRPKAGETLFVSAASGAVGHLVVQFAKALGLKVIASCGSDQKVSLVKSLGADHVFNYKTVDTAAELKQHGPVDIYFDNVGGPTLEAAIENAAQKARFVLCGMNLWLLNRYRVKMEGLIMTDWIDKYLEEFHEVVPRNLASGKLKYLEHAYYGMDRVGEAFVDLLTGMNVGKSVLVLEDAV
ncbi:NAD(P)-binding protein [Leucogyrophana mollusca]|uniref:NAD(P)-binding protein n=1 Tax=Leucogyrophana mollusca TaxID=85980 RepID=A0ACB8BPC5_9AGAM|nr:NAD(P)-binding protein [Leucogyrophana mollusca]